MCLEALKVKRVSLSNIYLSCRDNGIEITFLELALTKGLTIGGHSKWLIPCPLEEIAIGCRLCEVWPKAKALKVVAAKPLPRKSLQT